MFELNKEIVSFAKLEQENIWQFCLQHLLDTTIS